MEIKTLEDVQSLNGKIDALLRGGVRTTAALADLKDQERVILAILDANREHLTRLSYEDSRAIGNMLRCACEKQLTLFLPPRPFLP